MRITITKSDKRFAAVRFVTEAVSKETTRYAIGFLQVNADCIVAADGKRLHLAYIPHNWEPGAYEVLKRTKTTIDLMTVDPDSAGKFPKWDDIVPEHDHYFRIDNNDCADKFISELIGILARQGKGVGINLQYLKAASEIEELWSVYFGAETRPICAVAKITQDQTIKAVIMPVKTNYDTVEVKVNAAVA